MQAIGRDDLESMMKGGKRPVVVDVLDPAQYDEFHIAGAINVPVGNRFDAEIQKAVPDKQQPVVVYCYDRDCPASAKAAEKMERLGYGHVFDYTAGKTDWKNAGFPIEEQD